MTAANWLADGLAALMLATALYCAAHLVASWIYGCDAEPDVDLMHVAMGVAMAAMLVTSFDRRASLGWGLVFGGCAAWFTLRGIRAALRSSGRDGHHGQHVLACVAMVYMLGGLAAPAAEAGTSMPAMDHPTNSAATAHPSLAALGLTVLLLCYAGRNLAEVVAAGWPRTRGSRAPMLAPRMAIGCSIAMALAMGYLLLTG